MPLSPPVACCPGCQPQPLAATAVGQAFATFLALEVAQGAAAPDTQRGYHSQGRAWAAWCQGQGLCLATASVTAVKTYRQALVAAGYQAASIAHKLAILRRFYAALGAAGLRSDNPVQGVHPPRDRRALERVASVSEAALGRLLALVPRTATAAALRDRVLLALLGVQGLRTVEVTRANVEDVRAGAPALLRVRGKAPPVRPALRLLV